MIKNGRKDEAFDIFVVGLGIVSVCQLTHEVEQAIHRCSEVFFVDHGPGVAEHLRSLCPKVTNLISLQQENAKRIEAYDRISTAVIEAALTHAPVAFATYGHPRLLVYPALQILEAAARLNLRCKVLPGISMVDMMLCELGIDPGLHGLQTYEANDAMARNRPLQPDVPCFLLQIDALETGFSTGAASRPARFERFGRYLSQFYPPNHLLSTVSINPARLFRSRIASFPLRRLAENAASFTASSTLYIPPVRLRAVVYPELVRDMDDRRHLRRITAGHAAHSNRTYGKTSKKKSRTK